MSGKRRVSRGKASPPAAPRKIGEPSLDRIALAQLSHELRTPLTGLLGLLDMLERTPLDTGQLSHLRLARQAGETLLGLINDLLDSSGLAMGRLKLRRQAFDPLALLHETVDMLAPLAQKKHIEIRVEAEPLPEPLFSGDAYRIRQVLTNLLHNAIKFTRSGSIRASVHQEIRDDNPSLRFDIQDTGPGITAEKLAELRAGLPPAPADERPLHNGAGLGLFICRQIVQLMGGTLEIQSQPGKGSTFSFWVPAPRAASENGRAEPVARTAGGRKNPLVLVVEDNPENCAVAVAILTRLGCQTDVARDGQEAVQKVSERRYDLVLMDWQMSAMDGPSATRAIRTREEKSGGRIPIVALTASVREDQHAECLRAGMDDFLAKPYTMGDIETLLRRWIDPEGRKPHSS